MSTVFECSSLTVRFGGLSALDGLSFAIEEGSVVGLIGPNGSGKTTFFNTLTGLCAAASGTAIFKGKEITGRKPQEVYELGITRTFQRSRLCLSLSVFDNVVVGSQNRMNLNVFWNLLARNEFSRSVQSDFETVRNLLSTFNDELAGQMHSPVGGMSMIDRRRIEVCRALFADPSLILLDEPSAGMTPDETREFMDDILKIRETHRRMSIVIIEHEMEVIQKVADHCVVLNYGKKVAEGVYDEVVQDPWVQEAYLGVQ